MLQRRAQRHARRYRSAEYRRTHNAWVQRWQRAHKAKGLCVLCSQPAVVNHVHCAEHLGPAARRYKMGVQGAPQE